VSQVIENILIQFAMGIAALAVFLGALSLMGAVTQYIMAKANKIKVETAMLVGTTKRLLPGKNGNKPSV